jgi:hypothetical protein
MIKPPGRKHTANFVFVYRSNNRAVFVPKWRDFFFELLGTIALAEGRKSKKQKKGGHYFCPSRTRLKASERVLRKIEREQKNLWQKLKMLWGV